MIDYARRLASYLSSLGTVWGPALKRTLPAYQGTLDLGYFTVPDWWVGVCLFSTDSRAKLTLQVFAATSGALVHDTAKKGERFTLSPGKYRAAVTGKPGNDTLEIQVKIHHSP